MKTIVIDGTGHIAGRLGSHIAKRLLEGHAVKVVCTEHILKTGSLHRGKQQYEDFLNKRCVVQPRNGPFHYCEPSKFFTRVVRRMLPHKTKRGSNALKNLQTFEGIPTELIGEERMKCPKALLCFKANPIRKFYSFGELLSCYGWKYSAVTEKFRKIALEKENKIGEEEKLAEQNILKIKGSKQFNLEVEAELKRFE